MKMKFWIAAILVFGCACNVVAQNIDSLKAILTQKKEDSTKVDLLNEISKSYLNSEPVDALPYTAQAKDLAEKIGYQKGLASALKNTGIVYYQQSKYIEALRYWDQSLLVFESIGDKKGIANLQSNIGAIYKNYGSDSKALEYFFNSLRNSEQTGDRLRITTALNNIGSVYQHKEATFDKAREYYLRALNIGNSLGDPDVIGTTAANIGEFYLKKAGNDSASIFIDSALYYFNQSEKAFTSTVDIPYALNNLGKAYAAKKAYPTALIYHQRAYDSASKMSSELYMTLALVGLGDIYKKTGDNKKALQSYVQAELLAKKINSSYDLKDAYQGLASTYASRSDFRNAYNYQNLLSGIKDTIYNKERDLKVESYEFNFEIQKKQSLIDLQEVSIARQKLARNAFIAGFAMVLIIVLILYRNYRNKIKINKILDTQKAQIEGLLLNILPAEVSKELQQTGQATPRFYESVSVLFTDFKGFTLIADSLSPQQVVAELSECFTKFDNIIEKYGLEKIKTIGDAYMCAGGIPVTNTDHPVNMIKAAFEIASYMRYKNEQRLMNGFTPWEVRIGIHTGPLVAGVVGKKKYAYDIWGTTVNIASRMESNGEPGQVNISMATYELVKHEFECQYRGKIYAKNVGEIDMYFVKENFPAEPATTGVISDIKLMSES